MTDEEKYTEEDDKVYEMSSEEFYHKFSSPEHISKFGNLLGEFLKSLKDTTVTADLSRLSFPTAMMQPCSSLEKLSYFIRPNSLVSGIQKITSQLERFTKILSFMLYNVSLVPRKGFVHAKPYALFPTEHFTCQWKSLEASTNPKQCNMGTFVAEAVSMSPRRVASFYAVDESLGVTVCGSFTPKVSLSVNSAEIGNAGEIRVFLYLPTSSNQVVVEQYIVHLPSVCAQGIFVGEHMIEVSDKLTVLSKTYKAEISFYTQKNNELDGWIVDMKTRQRVRSINGNLTEKIHITDTEVGNKGLLFDRSTVVAPDLIVPSLSEQEQSSSRRIFHRLTEALMKENYEAADHAKRELETKKYFFSGLIHSQQWKPKFFSFDSETNKWVYNNSNVPKEEMIEDVTVDNSWGGYFKSFFA